jgi:hypothetical protein
MDAARSALQFERDVLTNEIDYRRERRAGILAWANTILLAIIGGVVALQQSSSGIGLPQRLIITAAIAIVASYSILWWQRQRNIGHGLHDRRDEVDVALALTIPPEASVIPHWIGGSISIALLAGAAAVATWIGV